jgi:hypothetical protein
MKFPKRLASEEGNAGDIARGILLDSEFGAPPPAAEHAVWTDLRAKLAAPMGGNPESGALPQISEASPTQAPIPVSGVAQVGGAGFALAKLGVVAGIVAGAGLTALTLHPARHVTIQQSAPPEPVNRVVQVNSAPASESSPAAASSASLNPVESATLPRPASDHTEPLAKASRDKLTRAADNDNLAKSKAAVGTARFSDESASSLPPTVPLDSAGSAGRVPSNSSERASQLLRETALLEQARAALRAGNTGQAWQTLEQWAAEFPSGQLNQEREALTIELLWRSGRRDLASTRIRAFERAYPKSAHAARLRALLTEQ